MSNEKLLPHLEYTAKLCAENPLAAKVRHELLEAERKAHATGWDGPNAQPMIFQIDTHPDKADVELTWIDAYTEMLHVLCDRHDGRVGHAMRAMAEHYEQTSEFLRTGEMPRAWDGLDPAWLDAVKSLDFWGDLHAAAARGADTSGPRTRKKGFQFYGLGLRHEAWQAIAEESAMRELYDSGKNLSHFPGRTELRCVYLQARDGHLWQVVRERRKAPEAICFQADSPFTGLMLNALSRLVNAVVGEQVPVVPLVRNTGVDVEETVED